MRKIKITSEIEKEVNDFYLKWAETNKKIIISDLENLKESEIFCKSKRNQYLINIIQSLDNLLTAKPTQMLEFKNEFERIIPVNNMDGKFAAKIICALKYGELRNNKECLKIIQNLNIKACPYCNANLTIVLEYPYKITRKGLFKKGEIKERKGNFDLDHFYPKLKHPYLGISFFNLIPCCSNCNRSKQDNPIEFHLFEETDDLDVFNFMIDEESFDQYLKTKNRNDLIVSFESSNEDLKSNHEYYFKITELYKTQLDVAEEIVHIKEAYNMEYKRDLVNTWNSLFPDTALIDQLLIRNYTKPDEIHKRPLAKFTQDIARQLKLIK
jgi:hypothetical protein